MATIALGVGTRTVSPVVGNRQPLGELEAPVSEMRHHSLQNIDNSWGDGWYDGDTESETEIEASPRMTSSPRLPVPVSRSVWAPGRPMPVMHTVRHITTKLHNTAVTSPPSKHRSNEESPPEFHMFFQTPDRNQEETLSRKRLQMTPLDAMSPEMFGDQENNNRLGPQPPKRTRVQRVPQPAHLSARLTALSKAQLVELLSKVVYERHPQLEQEVHTMFPEPDLSAHEDHLSALVRAVYKSFPRSRLGTARDVHIYRKVSRHLDHFRRECLHQGKALQFSQEWGACLDYTLRAWRCVSDLPTFDCPSHNAAKEQCYSGLAKQCKKALGQSFLEKERYNQFRPRFVKACQLNQQMEPCLRLLDDIIRDLP
ncbi:Hypp2532 [Branchiostoma lanceolatum]|uniref:Hypp2532 protein n=1 Tax=Branchiostoma lanceolatum TaxID=7740 RepID=A0A8J9ZW11_BRALA|nr:Hypp2532 [Branchiostoma lanceolatum]